MVHPTHYSSQSGWVSDTEPPIEELQKIRKRKKEQAEKRKEAIKKALNLPDKLAKVAGKEEGASQKEGEKTHQEEVKAAVMKRQIEEMRAKLKPNLKAEL